MIIQKLYLTIIIRISLICLTCLLFGFVNAKFRDFFINLNFILLVVIQAVLLIRKLNLVNHTLSCFFESIQYDDDALVLTSPFRWKSYQKLLQSIDRVNSKITSLKTKSAGQEAYFESLVSTVGIGLIGIDDQGKIQLFNPAARKILKYKEKSAPLFLNLTYPDLYSQIESQKSSEQKLIKLMSEGEILQLAVSVNQLKVLDKKIKLISIQNIESELDEKELETWQKMIRVLTHEIMNSISPINSTVNTVNEFLAGEKKQSKEPSEMTKEVISDVLRGLNIIQERSLGLIDFVNKFRSLTLLPKPQKKDIVITELFKDIELLLRKEISEIKIHYMFEVEPESLRVKADPKLLQQVMLNLIYNSMDAVEGTSNPTIRLFAGLTDENIEISITDNGKGIPPDQLENIFIPFFTMKEEGSGIGLSLSRQIMKLHDGNISVFSKPEEETVFTLRFANP
ncbi:MAG: hypothetical protein K8R53_15015 [Bacteroidales bacterium]|nr:hypothetical protein [Bacteroidales bacterium]